MKNTYNVKRSLVLLLILWVGNLAMAQEEERAETASHRPLIRGAVMMANSHVPNAYKGEKVVAIVPTWGFDVDYFFHKRWSVALQGDIKLQSFEVEHETDVLLERNFPIALATVLHYHARRHWSFYAGPGYEFEANKNLFLVRLGTEYSFEISEKFEIGLNLIYENKEELYDTWTFGIAFNRILWRRK